MSRRHRLLAGFSGVITGASTGIGRALALELAKKYSARLILNARDEKKLLDACAAVEELGGRAIAVPGDISDEGVQKRAIETCLEEFGNLELLVNNAGMAHPGKMTDLSIDDWRKVFEVNFFSALSTTYLALPAFQEQKFGKIVNVSSIAGKVAFSGSICYAASKFALTALSEGMAAEMRGQGVDVITVCPGWVRTDFFDKNNVQDKKNPTLIASKNDLSGWLMRNVLSISAEETAREIEEALSKGGSHELVMTIPGKLVERLHGICPDLIHAINSRLPVELVDSSQDKQKAATGANTNTDSE